ncbi:hypothetical protein L3X38_009666 [Prunus dulcis]|uniref:Tetratricopeptide repeat-like superfamily protein n=1 Tax=Prunus dulcis TaxID=3755 RepID=A0AAD4WGJ2_PRUDU|nr:hypothetical protein L3X38_009666 [Prunus dulcis]
MVKLAEFFGYYCRFELFINEELVESAWSRGDDKIQYLDVAENIFCRNNIYLGTPIYNTVLHSLVEAKENQMAIKIFKNMKSFGFPADAATYHIMIDCCSILGCYRSACALVSMMLRDGFYPLTVTYTILINILLEDDDIEEALNLLDQASSERNELDTLC